jgi:hypothetical protein
MKIMRTQHPRFPTIFSVALVMLAILNAGCSLSTTHSPKLTPTPSQVSRLRIKNQGTLPIKRLSVLFPDDEVEFGDVAAGATTDYKEVPHGVYHYSAFKLEVKGKMFTQVVSDWIGEQPMKEKAFTYMIDFSPNRDKSEIVHLIKVTED